MKEYIENCSGVIPFRINNHGEWEVLLLHHCSGRYWGFPKGRIEEGEQNLDAAVRELREESGLSIKLFFDLPPFKIQYTIERNEILVRKSVFLYVAHVQGECMLQREEIDDACWLSIENVEERLSFSGMRVLWQDVLRCLPF